MADQQQTNKNLVQLPLLANVAIYSKVATREMLAQNGQTQEDRLTQFTNELGYSGEQVTLFTDEGSAASKPLLERPGYTALLQAISKGNVTILLVSDVSRLLANATEMQVNIFIHRCIEKGVFVVTPQTVFDFSNLTLVHIFRQQCMSGFDVLAKATKQMQATQ